MKHVKLETRFTISVVALLILVGGDVLYLFVYQQINIILEIVLLLLTLAIISWQIWFVRTRLLKPLQNIKHLSRQIASGEPIQNPDTQYQPKEIQDIISSLLKLSSTLKDATSFVLQIGQGDFDAKTSSLDTQEGLGKALVEMRNQLVKISEEERSRNWSVNGIAIFADLLREHQNQELSEISYTFLKNMVHYVEANQGAVYIIDDNPGHEVLIEPVAAYAYARRKYLKKKFQLGEGLVGRCVQENDIIYMDDIPDGYIHISSGLGKAKPRSLMLSPIQVNEVTYGVIEIASFNILAPYQIEFIKTLAQNFASTVANAKINAHNRKLLENSDFIAQQLKEKEKHLLQSERLIDQLEKEVQLKELEISSLKKALTS